MFQFIMNLFDGVYVRMLIEPLEQFIHRVDAMELSLPAKIHVAVPSNQVCGSRIITKEP